MAPEKKQQIDSNVNVWLNDGQNWKQWEKEISGRTQVLKAQVGDFLGSLILLWKLRQIRKRMEDQGYRVTNE